MAQLSFIKVSTMPTIKQLPLKERPTSRLGDSGPTALSTMELLAALLQTPDAMQQAAQLLSRFGGLLGLAHASLTELQCVDGIGPGGAARIKASLELARRLMTEPVAARPQIRSPADAARLVVSQMSLLEQEHLRVILMDTKHHVLSIETVCVGSVNSAVVRVAEVLRPAIRLNAVAIILCHNHPSGDPSPSPEDIFLTETIRKAGELADIQVLDHLVIGQQRWVSMKESRLGFG